MMGRKALIIGIMALSAIACTRQAELMEGSIVFSVESDDALADVVKSRISDYGTVPSADEFRLEIKDSRSVSVWKGMVPEWSSENRLQAGSYTAAVEYGSVSGEGFGRPAFSGEAAFEVEAARCTAVGVKAKAANALVKLRCTENFENYFSDYVFVLKTGNLTEIPFVKGETRAAFIDPYKFVLTGILTTQAGRTIPFESGEFRNLSASTLYTVVLDVNNTGGLNVLVSFDNNVEIITLEEELND